MSRRQKPVCCILRSNDYLLVLCLCGFSMIVGCHDPDVAMAPKLREIQLEQIETEAQDPAAQGNEAAGATDSDPSKSVAATQSTVELSKPISLFDGKTLEYWEEIEFGGEGDVEIKDGVMSFEMGDPFTGIASTLEDLPKTNFEVSLEARKTCLLYTSPSPRDATLSRMPSSA